MCEVYRAIAEEASRKAEERATQRAMAKWGQELAENVKRAMAKYNIDQEAAMDFLLFSLEQRACCEPFL